jgi:hypothetical protein
MLVSRLVPVLVMGGIAAHSGGAIKERLKNVLGLGAKVVAKQRILAIMEVARLEAIDENPHFPNWQDPNDFRRWVRRAIRIRGNDRADGSLDPWGTPLTGQLVRGVLTLRSAGPDKQWSTGDDIVSSQNIFDY